jgi:hypothetical protein
MALVGFGSPISFFICAVSFGLLSARAGFGIEAQTLIPLGIRFGLFLIPHTM